MSKVGTNMIKYSIRRKPEVTEVIRDYVVSKLEKIENIFRQIKSQTLGGKLASLCESIAKV